MKGLTASIIAIAVASLGLAGCSGNEANVRSMEQIYAEDGVPVKTETIRLKEYSEQVDYVADLTPMRESSAKALIADKVEKVFGDVGDFVEKDAVVLTFPTDNPSANYYQSKVSFENAESTFRRVEAFYETGGLSQQDYDNARASFEVAKANWESARQSVMVKAPISGVISRLNVHESDNVAKEQELFAISQIDRMKAKIWVSEKQISAFKVGQKATATWNNITLEGRVVQVDISANRQYQAFGVLIEFDNPGMLVHGGVSADIRVNTYQESGVISIDRKNLVTEGNSTFVYVAEDGTAQKRKVGLRENKGFEVLITDGLAEGEQLIVEGQIHLSDGAKIRVVDGSHAGDATTGEPGAGKQ